MAEEVPQQSDAGGLALFGVKLRSGDVVAAHGGGDDVIAMLDRGLDHVRLAGDGVKGVNEVDEGVVAAGSLEQRVTAGAQGQRVPAHVRDLDAGTAHQLLHLALEPTEAGRAGRLLAALEQDLQPHANPEVGRARAHPLQDAFAQGCTVEVERRVTESALTGDDQPIGAAHVLGRIAADAGQMAEARRRLIESATALPYAFGPEITKTQPWEEPFPKLPWKASPQRDSFGPDMSLARFMLEKGDKETVLKYLDLCDKFWTLGGDKLTLWRKQINADEMPDFGSNLGYVFPRIKSNDR